ncbi:MAG: hypothetical protein ACRC4O_12030, partial [Giesbergeria sp.]
MPTGILSEPVEALATMLRGVTEFQAWVGAANAAAADASIYRCAVASPVRPFALIHRREGGRIMAGGYAGGELALLFEATISVPNREPDKHAEAVYEFMDPLGPIIAKLAKSGEAEGGALYIRRQNPIRVDFDVRRSD